MKSLAVITVLALASFVAVAQTTPGSTSPSGTNPSTQPQTSPSQTSDMPGSGSQMPNSDKKSEKSLKGCIQSSGGQFTLEDKHGKQVALTGSQDFASHVGHTVTVHGSFSGGSETPTSSGGMAASDQFTVSKIDMVSDKCSSTKSKKDMNDSNGKPTPNRY